MTVRFNPKTEALIRNEVERGAYSPAEEFVERAVELLHDHEQWLTENQPAIAAQIDHGFAQAGRGELIDGDEVASILRERRFAGQKIARGSPKLPNSGARTRFRQPATWYPNIHRTVRYG